MNKIIATLFVLSTVVLNLWVAAIFPSNGEAILGDVQHYSQETYEERNGSCPVKWGILSGISIISPL